MKRVMLSLASVLLAGAALAQFPIDGAVGYLLAGSTSVAYSNYWASGGQVRVSLDDNDQDATVKWSRDYLPDGDFEDDPRTSTAPYNNSVSPANRDQWDDDGALRDGWSQTEGAGGSIEVTSTELFGEESLLFDASGGTAVVEIGSNFNLDTYSGGFTGWTEDVNSGSGTVTEGTTSEHTSGGSEAILTGGSAHVDLEQAVTVVASTEYVLTAWMREGDASDLCDMRVQESTGGTDWLQADGTWAASEVDIATSSGTSYAQSVVTFTTDTGITGIRISFSADVSGDVCGIDDVSLALAPGTFIQASTLFPVLDTASDSYAVVANHQDGGTDSILQMQLRDAETCTGDSTCLYWDGSSDWTTTETWINCSNVGTTTTQCIETFAAHDAALTADHRVIVRLRAAMGTSEDVTLDGAFMVETVTHGTEGVLLVGLEASAQQDLLLPQGVRGRFVGDASGAIGIHFLGQFFGGE